MRRQVTCEQGTLEGLAVGDPSITAFRGVPFAAPPVGPLRWRPPQSPAPWQGVRCAFDDAPACLQPIPGASNPFYDKEWGMDPAIPLDEDCLYLNIWTPALRGSGADARLTGEPLPVMVWIHGGAYQCGCAMEKEFDGTALARQGVVVVSVAYRLNVFGFFSHRWLQEEAEEGAPYANFGWLDQQAALRWVRRNITVFGGDPTRICVFGQSAGAASVLAQCCAPGNAGLFSRAIMQSGAGLGYFNATLCSLESAQSTGARLMRRLGVENLDEARAVDAQTLFEGASRLEAPEGVDHAAWPMMVNWVPCVDGVFMPRQERDLILDGQTKNIDLVVGDTQDEFMVSDGQGHQVRAGREGNRRLIAAWQHGGGRAPYYYHFDVPMPGDDAGSFHSSDLWFVFGTLGSCWRPMRGCHVELSQCMSRYWTRFAAMGDPSGPGLVHWDRTDMHGDRFLHLGFPVEMRSGHRGA